MYKEIHPYTQDTLSPKNDILAGVRKPSAAYYHHIEAEILDTRIIRRVIPHNPPDGSIKLTRLVISDDHADDILIGGDEAEQIKKILLARKIDRLPAEIERLTSTIRSLHELLRARLH